MPILPFSSESHESAVQWRAVSVPAGTDPLNPFFVNCKDIFGGSNQVAYLKTEVELTGDQDARLAIGSAGAVKAWLNGRLVNDRQTSRGLIPDQEVFPVQLKNGINVLMLEIAEGTHGWAACARFLPMPTEGELIGLTGPVA
jgi:hypothetical protein